MPAPRNYHSVHGLPDLVQDCTGKFSVPGAQDCIDAYDAGHITKQAMCDPCRKELAAHNRSHAQARIKSGNTHPVMGGTK